MSPHRKTIKEVVDDAIEPLAAILGLLLLITPLLKSPNALWYSGIFDQNMWVITIGFLSAAILLTRFFLRAQSESKLTLTWLDGMMIVWLLWLIVTSLTASNFIGSLFPMMNRTGGLVQWISLVTIYFVVRTIASSKLKEIWYATQTAIIVIGTLVAFIGWWMLHFHLTTTWQLIGVFSNQTLMAHYLSLVIITTFIRWLTDGKKIWTWVTFALLFQLYALWLSYARVSYAVVLLVGIMIYLAANRQQLVTQARKYWMLAGIVAVGLLLVISFSIKGQAYFNFGETSFQHRVSAWALSLDLVKYRPITGWGLENYIEGFHKYFRPTFEGPQGDTEVIDNPHNFLSYYAVNTGIPGLIIFLLILFLALRVGSKNVKSPLALWALGLVVVYAGNNLMGYESIATTVVFIGALAYLGGLNPELFTIKLAPWAGYVAIGGAAIALAWAIGFGAIPWVTERIAWGMLLRGSDINRYDRVIQWAPYLNPELTFTATIPEYNWIHGNDPAFFKRLALYMESHGLHRANQPNYLLAVGEAWAYSDDPNRFQYMKNNLLKALAVSDFKDGYNWAFLALVEFNLGNRAAADADMQKALELNPNSVYTKIQQKNLQDAEYKADHPENTENAVGGGIQ